MTPKLLGDLTFAQLFLMITPKEQLTRRLLITPDAARRSGLVQREKINEGGSVASQIRARKAAERGAAARAAKTAKRLARERRRGRR